MCISLSTSNTIGLTSRNPAMQFNPLDFLNPTESFIRALQPEIANTYSPCCQVCGARYTQTNPGKLTKSGRKYWCKKCESCFETALTDSAPRYTIHFSDKLGRRHSAQFIGFGGYNQILSLNKLYPDRVTIEPPLPTDKQSRFSDKWWSLQPKENKLRYTLSS